MLISRINVLSFTLSVFPDLIASRRADLGSGLLSFGWLAFDSCVLILGKSSCGGGGGGGTELINGGGGGGMVIFSETFSKYK